MSIFCRKGILLAERRRYHEVERDRDHLLTLTS